MAFTRFLIYRKKKSWELGDTELGLLYGNVTGDGGERGAGMGVRGHCVGFHQGCGGHGYGMVRCLGRVADRSSWSKPCSRVGSIGCWRAEQEEL